MVKKIGYLTIDDAPSNDFRNKIDFLYENNIPAIFFCNGVCIKGVREEDIIYAIKKGYIIGNHSWSHANLSEVDKDTLSQEIILMDKFIDKLYQRAGTKRVAKVFRFPFLKKGGENRMEAQKILKKLGYTQPKFENLNFIPFDEINGDLDVSCTYDTMDWTVADGSAEFGIKTFDDLLNRIDEDVPNGGRGLNYVNSSDIIMMHDDERIKNMFQPLITRMLEKGIEFKEFKFS